MTLFTLFCVTSLCVELYRDQSIQEEPFELELGTAQIHVIHGTVQTSNLSVRGKCPATYLVVNSQRDVCTAVLNRLISLPKSSGLIMIAEFSKL